MDNSEKLSERLKEAETALQRIIVDWPHNAWNIAFTYLSKYNLYSREENKHGRMHL